MNDDPGIRPLPHRQQRRDRLAVQPGHGEPGSVITNPLLTGSLISIRENRAIFGLAEQPHTN